MNLAAAIAGGDHRALARGISLVENRDPLAEALLRELHASTGRAHLCGITGPPGAGKSTLVQRLAVALRSSGKQVAIVAVDPSSPFTGGALLGDRVRMNKALEDPAIFMRSVASRGHLGGLSITTADVISLIDAAGFDTILIETVGAGQSEVEIMRLAHTTMVVTLPGLGDEIQANTAGILEIADVFVVNKSDRDGADRTVRELRAMLDQGHMGKGGLNRWGEALQGPDGTRVTLTAKTHLEGRYGNANPGSLSWRPPIVKTVAVSDDGTEELIAAMEGHRLFLIESGRWQSRLLESAEHQLNRLVSALVTRHCFQTPSSRGVVAELVNAVSARKKDPFSAAEELLDLLPRRSKG